MKITSSLLKLNHSQEELQKLILALLNKYNQPMVVMYGVELTNDNSKDINLEGFDNGVFVGCNLNDIDITERKEVLVPLKVKKRVSLLSGKVYDQEDQDSQDKSSLDRKNL